VEANTIIAGNFRLLHEVGNDSVGRVFLGQALEGGESVAIKVMHPHLANEAEQVEAFLEAAEAARGIAHANVAPILTAGVDKQPYVVARWASGQSLERILTTRKLDVDVACEIGLHILAALAAAAEHGVHHQHLTPANVIVDLEAPGGIRTQVFDFGVADKVLGPDRGRACSAYDQQFLAPEILAGKGGDASSDLYSVGMILYSILSRSSARAGEATVARPSRDLTELVRYNPSIPEPLLRSLAGALNPGRSARIGTASEFARLLVPYVRPKLRSADPEHLNTLDPVLQDYAPGEVSPSVMLIRAPRPRTDSACPEEMLLEPTFPRAPSAPRLEALHADVFGKRRPPATVELETVVYAPQEQTVDAHAATESLARSAALAVGAGATVGAALAWLGTVI
jgi:serine/threonine protein kinase